MPLDFDSMIDAYLVRDRKPKQAGRYYPSEIGNCLRKVWFSYKYPQETEPELLKIFEVGNLMHDFMVRVLKSEKNPHVELLKSEFPVKMEMDGFLISGRVDDLIMVKADGRQYLVEVKSCKSVDYTKKPGINHEAQLQFYMHASGVHNGVILYVDKTDLRTKVFEIGYSPEHAERIMERFRDLNKHLAEDAIPEPEAKRKEDMKWMCGYCEYKERCASP